MFVKCRCWYLGHVFLNYFFSGVLLDCLFQDFHMCLLFPIYRPVYLQIKLILWPICEIWVLVPGTCFSVHNSDVSNMIIFKVLEAS
jgi:hypothetical protein